jgi:hypothetical protein
LVNCPFVAILVNMSSSFLSRLVWMGALCGLPFGSQATSTATQALSQALVQHDWDRAMTLGHQLSGPDLESVARGPAQAGVVPAMWLMGQARHLEGDRQDSANWIYQAFLGTRLDLATCRDRRTDGVLYLWATAFQDAVWAARMDVGVRSEAILQAARHYEHGPMNNTLAGWSCQQAVIHAYVRKEPDQALYLDHAQWPKAQNRAFVTFCQEAGLPLNQIDTFSTSTLAPLSGS